MNLSKLKANTLCTLKLTKGAAEVVPPKFLRLNSSFSKEG
jgi:hypothetical protein